MATDQDFQTAVAFVLRQEGGYVDDPADPGGATKYGITQRSYPQLDIAALTVDDATAIYYRDYWQPSGADRLPMPLALVQLDTAVNTGVGRAQQFLDQSGGDLTLYLGLREGYYRTLATSNPTLAKFLPGWLSRLSAVQAAVALSGVPLIGPALAPVVAWFANPSTTTGTGVGFAAVGVVAVLVLLLGRPRRSRA